MTLESLKASERPRKLTDEEVALTPASFISRPLIDRFEARNLDIVIEELGYDTLQALNLIRFSGDDALTELRKHYLAKPPADQPGIALSALCLEYHYDPIRLFGYIAQAMFSQGIEEARQIIAINYPQLTKANIEMALAGNADISEEWMKLGGFRVVNKNSSLPDNLTVNVNAQAAAVAATGNLGTFEQRIARYEQLTRQLAPASTVVTVDTETDEPSYAELDDDDDN